MPLQSTSIYLAALQQEDTIAATRNPACHITYNRDTWVKLLCPPSDYAANEAKLLCQDTPYTWIVWVPNHGELILERSDFYC